MTRQFTLVLSVVMAGSAAYTVHGVSVYAEAASTPPTVISPTGTQAANRRGAGADSLVGVFEGRTPCGAVAAEFTGFPTLNCEKIKWRLTLYRGPTTGNPTTWFFEGTRATRRGTWRVERGAGPGRSWLVYHLEYDGPAKVLSLLSVDGNVLLLLDRNLEVLVGDASGSYALNRMGLAVP